MERRLKLSRIPPGKKKWGSIKAQNQVGEDAVAGGVCFTKSTATTLFLQATGWNLVRWYFQNRRTGQGERLQALTQGDGDAVPGGDEFAEGGLRLIEPKKILVEERGGGDHTTSLSR